TLTYAYRWQRCDASGAGCTDIPNSTLASRRLKWADVAHVLQVVVTATDQEGQTGTTSLATDGRVAAPSPPSNLSPPVIAGTPAAREASNSDFGSLVAIA